VADPAEFAGAMLREFEAQSGTTENQIKLLINNVNALVTTFTTELLPAIKDVIQAVAPFLQQMREWVSANPELVAALGQAALALLGFKAASLAVSVALVGIIKPVALVAKGIGLLLSVVAVANPFSLLIAGAALLTAAIFAPWDEIGAYIDGKLSGISLYDSGKAMIQTLWSGAKGVIPRMVADIKARIAGILPDWLSNYLSGGGGDSAAPDAAVDMTGPLRPPRADGTYTQNNTITITPHPNQNPEAIANEVIRQQARRGRGGPAMPHLYDTPEDAQ